MAKKKQGQSTAHDGPPHKGILDRLLDLGRGHERMATVQRRRVLVDAELRGHDSHGALMLQHFIDWYGQGQLHPRPNVRVLRESPTAAPGRRSRLRCATRAARHAPVHRARAGAPRHRVCRCAELHVSRRPATSSSRASMHKSSRSSRVNPRPLRTGAASFSSPASAATAGARRSGKQVSCHCPSRSGNPVRRHAGRSASRCPRSRSHARPQGRSEPQASRPPALRCREPLHPHVGRRTVVVQVPSLSHVIESGTSLAQYPRQHRAGARRRTPGLRTEACPCTSE